MENPTPPTPQKAFWIAGWAILYLVSASTLLGLAYHFYRFYTSSRFPRHQSIPLAKDHPAAPENDKAITDEEWGERGGWLSSFFFRGDESFTSGRTEAGGWQMTYRFHHDGLFDSVSTDEDDEGADGF